MIASLARRFAGSESPVFRGQWGIGWPLLAVGLFLAASIGLSLILGAVVEAPSLLSRLLVMQLGAALVAAFLFAVAAKHGGVGSLGLSPFQLADPLWAGLSYLFFLPIYFFAAILWSRVLKWIEFHAPPQEILRSLSDLSGPELWLTLAIVVAIGPWFEELLFRAFLQQALQRRLGDMPGLILASAMFGFLHDPIAVVPVFSLGLLFGYLYRRSGRIWVGWLAHALHNGAMAALWIGFPELRQAIEGG